MPKLGTLRRVAELAEGQWGLLTRAQAEAAGLAWSTLSRLAADDAVLERLGRGVYRLRGVAADELTPLRAAWLQLAPTTPAWERSIDQGVVSHRSAAAAYGAGELPADRHEFTLPARRQTRRRDVRLHRATLRTEEVIWVRGLPVTRPARIAADLLTEREDPEAIGRVVADALRTAYDDPAAVRDAIAPYASRYGLPAGDGTALLAWLLEPIGDVDAAAWLAEATPPARTRNVAG
jgi:predicted transcriptional regulator of viral defense system